MLDAHLHAALVVIDGKGVALAELVVKAEQALAGIDEVPGVLPDMEPNKVSMQQALQQLLTPIEALEDGRGRKSLVEVEADIRCQLLALPHVVGYKHELIAVDPDRL